MINFGVVKSRVNKFLLGCVPHPSLAKSSLSSVKVGKWPRNKVNFFDKIGHSGHRKCGKMGKPRFSHCRANEKTERPLLQIISTSISYAIYMQFD